MHSNPQASLFIYLETWFLGFCTFAKGKRALKGMGLLGLVKRKLRVDRNNGIKVRPYFVEDNFISFWHPFPFFYQIHSSHSKVYSTRVKCYVLDTALFLASRTLLDTCLSLKEFLMNQLLKGEPILGSPDLNLLIALLLFILQKAFLKNRREEKTSPVNIIWVLDPTVPEGHCTILLPF